MPDEAGDEGVPRDRVPDGHSVEHVEGVAEEAAPGVHVEQGGGGDGVEVGCGLDHERVGLAAEGGEGAASGEEGRERVSGEGGAPAVRTAEEVEGVEMRCIGWGRRGGHSSVRDEPRDHRTRPLHSPTTQQTRRFPTLPFIGKWRGMLSGSLENAISSNHKKGNQTVK